MRDEVAKLRKAIAAAGFAVLQTSGEWSIHDVSQKALADEKKTDEVLAENASLFAEVARLKAQVSQLAAELRQAQGRDRQW